MKQILRPLSSRPELLVDKSGDRLVDPTDQSQVGIPGPFGRERCVFALPLNGFGARQYAAMTLLRDEDSAQIAAPDSTVIGQPSLWISRLLDARWVEDTRG